MATSRRTLVIIGIVLLLAAMTLAGVVLFTPAGISSTQASTDRAVLPLAIIGDSDSHSFQDFVSFPAGSPERGGKFRATTFNWPEVLARLRGDQIDLGAWGIWGPPRVIAKAKEVVGLEVRRPRKEDYQYNFALSGTGCRDLNTGWWQVGRLLATMKADPQRWQNGIVVIRIGVNSFGQTPQLTQLAQNPLTSEASRALDECIAAIRQSIDDIRAQQPRMRFVLVGIFDNAHWAKNLDQWHSQVELANISTALDRFDDALRKLAEGERNLAFFDDRAWFARHWGSRDADGVPAYRDVVLANGMHVSNSAGDHPSNAVVADGHAGTVWNALWAEALVDLLNERFGTSIRPISADEIAEFASANTPP